VPSIGPRFGVAIIVIAALLAIAASTTPTAPHPGHASPAPAAEGTPPGIVAPR
jgi:hypothetical protein